MVAHARREIVICAGAIDSPRLLMLSGIGPAGHLAANGIEVIANRPGVGANFQDHLICSATVATTESGSMNRQLFGIRQVWHGLRYALTRTGPVAMGTSSAGGFVRVDRASGRPQIQFSFRPFSAVRGNRAPVRWRSDGRHDTSPRGPVVLPCAGPCPRQMVLAWCAPAGRRRQRGALPPAYIPVLRLPPS